MQIQASLPSKENKVKILESSAMEIKQEKQETILGENERDYFDDLIAEFQTNNVSLIFFNNLKYELEETLGLKVDLVHGQWRMELLVEHQIQLLVLMKHVHVLKS